MKILALMLSLRMYAIIFALIITLYSIDEAFVTLSIFLTFLFARTTRKHFWMHMALRYFCFRNFLKNLWILTIFALCDNLYWISRLLIDLLR